MSNKARKARKALGLCVDCGAKPKPGGTRCAEHSARNTAYRLAAYYRQKAELAKAREAWL